MAGDDVLPSDLAPRPAAGRVFAGRSRPVRFADVHPSGRLRLDGIARYLQDLSADDTVDAALPEGGWWIVRRTVVEVSAFPRYLELLTTHTWCSGVGSHYAERRASLLGERGGRIEAASLWVNVDKATGRPTRLPPGFLDLYEESTDGRRANARLQHGDPPDDLELRPWAVRATDFDMWRHVNNSVYWAIVEEALAEGPPLVAPVRAEVEHRNAVDAGSTVTWGAARDGDDLAVWVLAEGRVATTAVVRPHR
jgi:acyl-ACP thioesterase